MINTNKKTQKRIVVVVAIIVVVIVLGLGIFAAIGAYKISLIPNMSFNEMMKYTTNNNKNAIISVGVIKNGQVDFEVYGENGKLLPKIEHEYEIGSITKTFTCSLLCKAISEGKLNISDSIDQYIDLPSENNYPTFKKLVTHTSGYKGYYFDGQMTSNFFHHEENDFYGISTDTINKQISKHITKDKVYEFKYSNFGISVVGSALANIYQENFTTLMNHYILSDLGLHNTKISDNSGNLNGYWKWKSNDGYIPSGAITSTISDMLCYAKIHMTEQLSYLGLGHDKLETINATTKQYGKMGVRMDTAGIGWMIDTQNNIIWHNGATSNYNCYIGFNKEKQVGVVILSNLSPNYRIPATVMGPKLMKDNLN